AAARGWGPRAARPRPQRRSVPADGRVRDRRIVEPRAEVVVQAIAGAHVEPRVLDLLELLEPLPPRVARRERGVDLGRRAAVAERRGDAGVDRQPCEAPQLLVRAE